MKWKSFVIKLGLFCAGFALTAHFCLKQTDGLTIEALRSSRPYNAKWEGRTLSATEENEVNEALSLKYRYYGRGGQSFIFFSQGEKYVLKFFRQEVFTTALYFDFIPSFFTRYKTNKAWKKADKLERDFTSYKFAQNELQDLTGVLYIHLNPTTHLAKKIALVDRLGIVHTLNLDDFNFVLQRKADFVYDRINDAMIQNNPEKAKERITSLFNLVVKRCRRGFRDRDPNIKTNCGFIGEEAIKIDVGRFESCSKMQEPCMIARELRRIAAPFREWIAHDHPDLLEHVDKELEARGKCAD